MLVGIAIATPAFTLCFIFAGFLKAVHQPAIATLLLRGSVALLAAGLVFILSRWILPTAGVVNIGIAYAVGAWAIAGQGLWLCWRWFAHRSPIERAWSSQPEFAAFRRSSSAFFASNVARFLMAILGIWVAGYFLSNSDVGLFKAAQQLSGLIGVILIVLNAILPPRFAKAYHEGDYRGLHKLARRGVLIGLALATAPVLVCLITPEWVLSVFGQDFPHAAMALRILAAGRLVGVGCGSVGYVLNMTAREGLQRNIAWIGNGLGLIAILVLTPLLGVTGTAIGVVVGIAVGNFLGLYFVWRRVGIWMLPLPNVLRILGVHTITSRP